MNNDVIFNIIAETNKFDGAIQSATNKAGELDKAMDGASNSSSNLKNNLITGAVAGVAASAANKLMTAIASMKDEALQASDALDGYNYALGFIGINESKIESSKAILKDYALSTTYNMKDVLKTAQVLGAAGEKEFDRVTTSLGNVVAMGDGAEQEFSAVSDSLGKINTIGKVTAKDWQSFTSNIPAAASLLKDKLKEMGVYTGDFATAMSKGKITAADFNKALVELGDNDFATEYAKGTAFYTGSMNNLKNSVINAWLEIEGQIGKSNITGMINEVAEYMTKAGSVVSDVIGVVKSNGDWLAPLAKSGAVMAGSYTGIMKVKAGYGAVTGAVKSFMGIQAAQVAVTKQASAATTAEAVANTRNATAVKMSSAMKARNSAIVATNIRASKLEATSLRLGTMAQSQYARGSIGMATASKMASAAVGTSATIVGKSSMALGNAAGLASKFGGALMASLGPVGIATIAIGALTFGISKYKESQAKAVEEAHNAAETMQGKMTDALTKAEERYSDAAESITGSLSKIAQQQALVGTGVKGFTNNSLAKTIIDEHTNISESLKDTLEKQLQDEIQYIQTRKTLTDKEKKDRISSVSAEYKAKTDQANANQKGIEKISEKIRSNNGKATKEDIAELEKYVEKAKALAKKITPDAEGKLDKFTSKTETGGKLSKEDKAEYHKALEETYGKEIALIEEVTAKKAGLAESEKERTAIMTEGAKEQGAVLDKMWDSILKANGAETEGISLAQEKNGLLKVTQGMTDEQKQSVKEFNEYLTTQSPEAAKAWAEMSGESVWRSTEEGGGAFIYGQNITQQYMDGLKANPGQAEEIVNTIKQSVENGFSINGEQVFYKGVDVSTAYSNGIKSKTPDEAIAFIKSQVDNDNMIVDKTGEGGEVSRTYAGGIDGKSNDVAIAAKKAADKAKQAKAPNLSPEGAKVVKSMSTGVDGSAGLVSSASKKAMLKAKDAKAPNMKTIGAAVPEGMAAGMNGSSNLVVNAAAALAAAIPAKIRKLLGINSPAKKLIPTGISIPEGISVGITRGTAMAVKSGVVSSKAIMAGIQTTIKKTMSTAGLANVVGANYVKMLKNAQAAALKGVTDPEQAKAIRAYWDKLIKDADLDRKRTVELAGIDDNFNKQLANQESSLTNYRTKQNKAQDKALKNSKKLKKLRKALDKKGITSKQRKKINADIKKEENRIKNLYQSRIKQKEKQVEANKKLIQQRYDLAKANAKNKQEVEDLNKAMEKELENAGKAMDSMQISYLQGNGGQTGLPTTGSGNNTNVEQILFEINTNNPDEVSQAVTDALNNILGKNIRNGVSQR